MPGCRWVGKIDGSQQAVPGILKALLANSLTGTGTPPAASVLAGDIVVRTTKSTITSGGTAVVRMLLAADKTAHYLQGTPVAGLLGVAGDSVSTNASGVSVAPPAIGGIATGAGIPYPYSGPGMWGNDPLTGRSYLGVLPFTPDNVFGMRLDTTTAAILTTTYQSLVGTLGGIIMSTTSGVTTYTLDWAAAAADSCLMILGPNTSDPLYGQAVAQNAAVGPEFFFIVLPSFEQTRTGVNYSSN